MQYVALLSLHIIILFLTKNQVITTVNIVCDAFFNKPTKNLIVGAYYGNTQLLMECKLNLLLLLTDFSKAEKFEPSQSRFQNFLVTFVVSNVKFLHKSCLGPRNTSGTVSKSKLINLPESKIDSSSFFTKKIWFEGMNI